MERLGAVLDDGGVLPRRDFLSQATLAAVATVLAACSGGGAGVTGPSASPNPEPTPGTSGSTLTVTLAAFGALANVGGIAAVGNLGVKPIAVVRTGATTYTALSRICTHAGCAVTGITNGVITCPCHNSEFSVADGSVKKGPATEALAAEQITVSGDSITLA